MVRNFARFIAILTASIVLVGPVLAEETVVRTLSIPFASIEQEVIYSTNEDDYNQTRDDTLRRMKEGDKSAFVNPRTGPWLRGETVVAIGIEWNGFAASEGRKNVRQVSAAEEALFLFERLNGFN